MDYRADATKLEAGSIVKIEKPLSSAGYPTYSHYFIVLVVPDDLKSGDLIPLVGVSSRISSGAADPAKHVAMKWLNRPGGNPETGFEKPTFECVDFPAVVMVEQGSKFALEVAVAHQGRFIDRDKLHTVVALRNAFARAEAERRREGR